MFKKIQIAILSCLCITIIGAKPVDVKTATTVALNYYNHVATQIAASVSLEETNTLVNGEPIYFIFNVNANDGFVIVAGDDASLPILGYSTTGHYFKGKAHANFVKWMSGYRQQIMYIKTNHVQPTENINSLWISYKTNSYKNVARRAGSVAALCKAQWGQDPYENLACPYDSAAGKNCVTGCPATAMAQILKYWEFPVQGHGSNSYKHPVYGTLSSNFANVTYDWSSMTNTITGPNNAIAKLMSDCGIAVEMQYSPNSSGSYVIKSYCQKPEATCEYAYTTYFGYDTSTVKGVQKKDYTDSQWIALLKNELDSGRPMQYAGFGGGGHTFVCDGYDAQDNFHMNWGWTGQLDGFYALTALSPGAGNTGSGEGHFNRDQQAVIGIKPTPGAGTTNPAFKLALDSAIVSSLSPILAGKPLTVKTAVKYSGNTSYTTDLAAILYNEEGVLVSYIEVLKNQVFSPNSSKTITFSSTGLTAIPADHHLGIYSSLPNDSSWRLIKPATFVNPISILVSGEHNDLQLNEALKFSTNKYVVVKGAPLTVTASIKNNGTSSYSGPIFADLFHVDATYISAFGVVPNINIAAGSIANGVVFSTTALNLEPGSYYLALFDSIAGDYPLLSNTLYDNPIVFDVVEAPLTADIYEINNTKATAYSLPVTFTGTSAVVQTTGSNMHVSTDIDYYKLVLPTGFDYKITGRLQDEGYSNNGTMYTCDNQVSFDLGNGVSDNFDDSILSVINVNNGGTVVFKVSTVFAGMMGTYLLDLQVTKGPVSNVNTLVYSNNYTCFPNPANNEVHLDVLNANIKTGDVKILNNMGQTIAEYPNQNFANRFITFDVSNLASGIYYFQIQDSIHGLTTKKIVISK